MLTGTKVKMSGSEKKSEQNHIQHWIGSLSNYDDDHYNDFKKTIGLMIKTTALQVHHAF